MVKLGRRFNEVWLIDEEDAKKLLSKNYEKNRSIKERMVYQYARDMESGNWRETPDPLIITEGGKLLNGQHRLNAVIKSHQTIAFEVRIVPDESIFKYVDNGLARTTADYVEGKNKADMISIANFIYCARNGNAPLHSTLKNRLNYENNSVIKATRNEMIDFIEGRDGLEAIAQKARAMNSVLGCGSRKIYGAFIWLVQTLGDDNLSDAFIEDFIRKASMTSAIIIGKGTIQRQKNVKGTLDNDWLLGSLLMMYEYFCSGVEPGRINQSARYFEAYDRKLQDWREARRKYGDIDLI